MTYERSPRDAVRIERSFDAPVEVIWRMWTVPEHFAAWYGPEGATLPVANMDVRVGGERFVGMQLPTPNGPMRMWFTGEYREVVENELLVYTKSPCDENGNLISPADIGMPAAHPMTSEVRVEITEIDGRTHMTMTHYGIPADSPGAAGWIMAFDRLAAHTSTSRL